MANTDVLAVKPRRALWRDEDERVTTETVELAFNAPSVSGAQSREADRVELLPPAAVPVPRGAPPVRLSPKSTRDRVSLGEALHNTERGHKFYWRWGDEQLLRKTLLKASAVHSQQKEVMGDVNRLTTEKNEYDAQLAQLQEALNVPGQSVAARGALQQRKIKVLKALSRVEESILAVETMWGGTQALSLDADDIRILRGARATCGGKLWPLPEDMLVGMSTTARPASAGAPGRRASSVGSGRTFFRRFIGSLGPDAAAATLRAADAALDAATGQHIGRRGVSPSQRWVEVEERLQVPLSGSGVFRRCAPSPEQERDSLPPLSTTVVRLKSRCADGSVISTVVSGNGGNGRPFTSTRRPSILDPIRGAVGPAATSPADAINARLTRAMAQARANDSRLTHPTAASIGRRTSVATTGEGSTPRGSRAASRRSSAAEVQYTPLPPRAATAGPSVMAAAPPTSSAVDREKLRRMEALLSQFERQANEQAARLAALEEDKNALANQLVKQAEAFNTLRTQTYEDSNEQGEGAVPTNLVGTAAPARRRRSARRKRSPLA